MIKTRPMIRVHLQTLHTRQTQSSASKLWLYLLTHNASHSVVTVFKTEINTSFFSKTNLNKHAVLATPFSWQAAEKYEKYTKLNSRPFQKHAEQENSWKWLWLAVQWYTTQVRPMNPPTPPTTAASSYTT